jgi:CheY-like chemotaxis protein
MISTIAGEAEAVSTDSTEPSRAPRRFRILVADDERDTVLTLTALLRDEGHEVRAVYHARDALPVVHEFDPDAALLDIAMPGQTGWDVARDIRRVKGHARPLLIALSGVYKNSADKILSEIAGFNYYLSKPYEPKVLMALLGTLAARGL